MYTIFGGADFGGGIWTLLATGPRKQEQRNALERAIGPVWETNHVWLILVVVTLFVVFPAAYAAIFTALYVPLFIALLGIVARGTAFALRHYGAKGSRLSQIALQSFSGASVLTPFALGLSIGAVTGGHIKLTGTTVSSGAFTGWLQPFAITCGLIGLLLCAFLTAAYMIPRTEGELRRDFRQRAIAASLALGAVTTAAILIAHLNASEFSEELSRPSVLAGMVITACVGLVTLGLLLRGESTWVPILAAATAGGVILSWALAQNPDFIAPGLSLQDAAAASITVKSFLIALACGAVILVPSLLLLYLTFSRDVFGEGKPGIHGEASH